MSGKISISKNKPLLSVGGKLILGNQQSVTRLRLSIKALRELFPEASERLEFLKAMGTIPVYFDRNSNQSISHTPLPASFFDAFLGDTAFEISPEGYLVAGDSRQIIGLEIVDDDSTEKEYIELADLSTQLEKHISEYKELIERSEKNTKAYGMEVQKAEKITKDMQDVIKKINKDKQKEDQQYFESFTTRLRVHYTKDPAFKNITLFHQGTDSLLLMDCFIALKFILLETSEVKEKTNTEYSQKPSPRDPVDHLSSTKSITLSELFAPLSFQEKEKTKQEAPNHVLIDGRAGSGKTTLTRYLAHVWAQPKVAEEKLGAWTNRFGAVVLIPLQVLKETAYSQQYSTYDREKKALVFAELVCHHSIGHNQLVNCFNDAPTIEAGWIALQKLLDGYKDQILYILDGFDEVASLLSGPERKLTLGGGLLKQLLEQPHWLMTSRPDRGAKIVAKQYDELYRHIESIGLADDHLKSYITLHMGNSLAAQSLLNQIEWNGNLREIAYLPLNLSILCLAWQEKKNQPTDLQMDTLTQTEIYEQLRLLLIRRCIEEKLDHHYYDEENYAKDYRDATKMQSDIFAVLAWHLMQTDALTFVPKASPYQKLIEDCFPKTEVKPTIFEPLAAKRFFTSDEGLHLGLLKVSGEPKEWQNQTYEFSHLTIQEFFAARYVVTQLKEVQSVDRPCIAYQGETLSFAQLVARLKYDRHFEIFWFFVAGLMKADATNLHSYFKLLLSEPADLLGLYQAQQLMFCMQESQIQRKIHPVLLTKMENSDEKSLIEKIDTIIQPWIRYFARDEGNYYSSLESNVFYQTLRVNPLSYERYILPIFEALLTKLDSLHPIMDKKIIRMDMFDFEYSRSQRLSERQGWTIGKYGYESIEIKIDDVYGINVDERKNNLSHFISSMPWGNQKLRRWCLEKVKKSRMDRLELFQAKLAWSILYQITVPNDEEVATVCIDLITEYLNQNKDNNTLANDDKKPHFLCGNVLHMLSKMRSPKKLAKICLLIIQSNKDFYLGEMALKYLVEVSSLADTVKVCLDVIDNNDKAYAENFEEADFIRAAYRLLSQFVQPFTEQIMQVCMNVLMDDNRKKNTHRQILEHLSDSTIPFINEEALKKKCFALLNDLTRDNETHKYVLIILTKVSLSQEEKENVSVICKRILYGCYKRHFPDSFVNLMKMAMTTSVKINSLVDAVDLCFNFFDVQQGSLLQVKQHAINTLIEIASQLNQEDKTRAKEKCLELFRKSDDPFFYVPCLKLLIIIATPEEIKKECVDALKSKKNGNSPGYLLEIIPPVIENPQIAEICKTIIEETCRIKNVDSYTIAKTLKQFIEAAPPEEAREYFLLIIRGDQKLYSIEIRIEAIKLLSRVTSIEEVMEECFLILNHWTSCDEKIVLAAFEVLKEITRPKCREKLKKIVFEMIQPKNMKNYNCIIERAHEIWMMLSTDIERVGLIIENKDGQEYFVEMSQDQLIEKCCAALDDNKSNEKKHQQSALEIIAKIASFELKKTICLRVLGDSGKHFKIQLAALAILFGQENQLEIEPELKRNICLDVIRDTTKILEVQLVAFHFLLEQNSSLETKEKSSRSLFVNASNTLFPKDFERLEFLKKLTTMIPVMRQLRDLLYVMDQIYVLASSVIIPKSTENLFRGNFFDHMVMWLIMQLIADNSSIILDRKRNVIEDCQDKELIVNLSEFNPIVVDQFLLLFLQARKKKLTIQTDSAQPKELSEAKLHDEPQSITDHRPVLVDFSQLAKRALKSGYEFSVNRISREKLIFQCVSKHINNIEGHMLVSLKNALECEVDEIHIEKTDNVTLLVTGSVSGLQTCIAFLLKTIGSSLKRSVSRQNRCIFTIKTLSEAEMKENAQKSTFQ